MEQPVEKERMVMMRHLFSLGTVVVMLFLIVVPYADAQEATPPPEMVMTGEITAEHTNLGVVPALVPAPAAVNFFRVHFPPGVTLAYLPGDPGIGLWRRQ